MVNTVRSVTAQSLNASRAEINKGPQVCVDVLTNYNLPLLSFGVKREDTVSRVKKKKCNINKIHGIF